MVDFSMPNSIPNVLTVYSDWISRFFSFLANSLTSFIYLRWFIFSCDLVSLYPAVNFLSMWLSGIIAIININGDNAPSWNILVSTKLFRPAVNSTLQVFMVFSIKSMISSDILYILRQFIFRVCVTISYAFL